MMWWWGLALAAEGMLRPELGTHVPLDLSVGLLGEVAPAKGPAWRLRASMGVMPRAYLVTANSAAQALFDGYTPTIRALVEIGLDDATVVRVHGGLRPAPKYGLYAHTGWTMISAKGAATGSEVVEAVTDVKLPPVADAVSVQVSERVHFADVEVGWEEPIADGPVTVRVGLGWSFAVGAQATLTPNGLPDLPVAQSTAVQLAAQGEAEIELATKAYVHPPSLALAIGWAFR